MVGKTLSHYKIIEKLGKGGTNFTGQAPDPKTLVITSIGDLQDSIPKWPHLNSRRTNIALRIPNYPTSDQARFEKLLEKHLNDCGCKVGALTVLFMTFVYIAYLVFHISQLDWSDLWWGFILVLTAAVCGKGVGLLIARTRLNRTLSLIRKSAAS